MLQQQQASMISMPVCFWNTVQAGSSNDTKTTHQQQNAKGKSQDQDTVYSSSLPSSREPPQRVQAAKERG